MRGGVCETPHFFSQGNDMKTCTKCKEIKSLSEFAKDKYKKDGRRSNCKECYSLFDKEKYWKNPEIARNRTNDYRSKLRNKSPEKLKLSNRNTKLKRAYGITHNDYLLMLEQQNYKCACCGIDNKDSGVKGLVVDHNHTTGEVRQLLCNNCNTALGLLKEDKTIINNLLKYIEEYNG